MYKMLWCKSNLDQNVTELRQLTYTLWLKTGPLLSLLTAAQNMTQYQ